MELCLKSILQQKELPNEILIADDGSDERTSLLIEQFKSLFSVPLKHIWHADEGFQLAKIRNRAIAASTADYIIQVDGDLILHPYFIRDHIQHAEPGYFVTGSRQLLSKNTTEKILNRKTVTLQKFSPGSKNILNGLRNRTLRIFLAKRYKIKGKYLHYVKGCNMAFWKKDLLAVNGYNENIKGWGVEDSEIAVRLLTMGVGKKFIKMGGIAYHLFHKEASRANENKNWEIHDEVMKTKTVRTLHGIDQYL